MLTLLNTVCPIVRDLTILAQQTDFENLAPTDASHLIWDFFHTHEYEDIRSIEIKNHLEEFYSVVRSPREYFAQLRIIQKMFRFLLANMD